MTRDVLLHGLLLLHALASCGLVLYGLNCYVLLVLHGRAWRTMRQPETAGRRPGRRAPRRSPA